MKEKEKKEEQKEPEKKEPERFVVAAIPTQTEAVIKDNKTGNIYDVTHCLCMICNEITKLKETIA